MSVVLGFGLLPVLWDNSMPHEHTVIHIYHMLLPAQQPVARYAVCSLDM